MYQHITVPADGQKITVNADRSLNVPDQPIIPFIEGDGTGSDITPVMIKVVDAAVAKAYGGARKISWMEIFAGEKATRVYGADTWLPAETLAVVKEYLVSIKGPLTTPVGGGMRSLNVALRQQLDLYQVGLGFLAVGVADIVLQPAVVGQQQQAFAVGVEPAGRVDAGNGQVIGQRDAAILGGELAQDLEWFVKKN